MGGDSVPPGLRVFTWTELDRPLLDGSAGSQEHTCVSRGHQVLTSCCIRCVWTSFRICSLSAARPPRQRCLQAGASRLDFQAESKEGIHFRRK